MVLLPTLLPSVTTLWHKHFTLSVCVYRYVCFLCAHFCTSPFYCTNSWSIVMPNSTFLQLYPLILLGHGVWAHPEQVSSQSQSWHTPFLNHTYRQVRAAGKPNPHVFGLWECTLTKTKCRPKLFHCEVPMPTREALHHPILTAWLNNNNPQYYSNKLVSVRLHTSIIHPCGQSKFLGICKIKVNENPCFNEPSV